MSAAAQHRQRAEAALEMNRGDEALRLAATALAMDPDDSDSHLVMGQALWATGQRDQAIDAVRAAIAVDPVWSGYHRVLAAYLYDMDRFAQAREPAEAAVRLAPEEPWVLRGAANHALNL